VSVQRCNEVRCCSLVLCLFPVSVTLRVIAEGQNHCAVACKVAQVEGYMEGEIAGKLGCSPRTVRRKLTEIRDCWRSELKPS
jgi:ECF sigma factor